MSYLIDPPSELAPLNEWKKFLADIGRINDQNDPGVMREVANARAVIRRKENENLYRAGR
jgi:hypothetical protein